MKEVNKLKQRNKEEVPENSASFTAAAKSRWERSNNYHNMGFSMGSVRLESLYISLTEQ